MNGGASDRPGDRLDVHVASETGPLEIVVTSPPGREFDRMVPENLERFRADAHGRFTHNRDYLLFDDLVLTSALTAEHAELVRVLEAVVGREGHATFRELLQGALDTPGARRAVVADALALDGELYGVSDAQLARAEAGLLALDAARLADALIVGTVARRDEALLRWPAPNVLFARDLAAAVGSHVVVTHAAEPGRRRDMRLMRAVLEHHPLFADTPRIDLADDGPVRPTDGSEAATVEGGDIQVMSERVVVIGVGVRTTLAAVERLAPRLHAAGFEVVLACEMPRRRAAMHLDTLFTRVDAGQCLVWPPLVEDAEALGLHVHRYERGAAGPVSAGADLLTALADVGEPLTPIRCGGDDPVAQAREQWSDGANAFALAPGVIVTYGRNERTAKELGRAGFTVVTPEEFVRNAGLYTAPGSGRRVAVALGGHELVRGRGGPRCLTMPLRRGAVSSG